MNKLISCVFEKRAYYSIFMILSGALLDKIFIVLMQQTKRLSPHRAISFFAPVPLKVLTDHSNREARLNSFDP
jgi:hypothetical protein